MLKAIAILSAALMIGGCTHLSPAGVDARLADLDRRAGSAFEAGEYDRAERHWEEAAELARDQGRKRQLVRFLVGLSRVAEAVGAYDKAGGLSLEGRDLARRLGEADLEVDALDSLGLIERRRGNLALALEHSTQARTLARDLNDPVRESEALRGMGAVYQARADDARAFEHYRDSLALARRSGDAVGEARTLNNLGGLHRQRGEYADALRRYTESLAIRERIGDPLGEGKVLGNMCLAYYGLGDAAQAKQYCQRALAIALEVGARPLEANTRNSLAALARGEGDYRRALKLYRASIAIKRDLPDPAGEARGLNNVGELHRLMGDRRRAVENLTASLRLKQARGDRSGEAASHLNLGLLKLGYGEDAEARAHFEQALYLQAEARPELRWRALDGLSQGHRAAGNRALAIFFGKQAVNTLQSVRRQNLELDQRLRRSFLDDRVAVYRRLTDLLIEEGRLPEARQVMGMLKEEEYHDFVRGRDVPGEQASTAAALTTGEQPWAERYAEISTRLVALGRDYDELRGRSLYGLEDDEAARLEQLKNDMRVAREAFRSYLSDVETAFFAQGPQRAMEFGAKALETLEQVQAELANLGPGAVLVHYLVTEKRLRLLLTTPTQRLHRESAIEPVALNRLVAAFRDALQDPSVDPGPMAEELHDHLIGPIEEDLRQAGAVTLLLAPDDILRYLPFAALHDGSRYLVDRYSSVIYAPAARRHLATPPREDWRVAGLGVSQAVGEFSPLPAVAMELDAIVKEERRADDRSGVLPGFVALDERFTADGLSAALHAGFPVVHIASHFVFRPGDERDSFLLLGGDERISLADLQDGDFPLTGVDLLSLSACETAVGGRDARGREVEGFGAIAQNKGAKAVLATLWSVADRTTAALMARFYQLREDGETKTQALRKAQLEFIHWDAGGPGEGRAFGERGRVLTMVDGPGGPAATSELDLDHPYFWAPFILMGNGL